MSAAATAPSTPVLSTPGPSVAEAGVLLLHRRSRRPARGRVAVASKTVGALALLHLALPANLMLTAAATLRLLLVPQPRPWSAEPRTILLSGGKMTKALQLARSFHRAGHRVILVEVRKYRMTGHRFSRDVDRFYTVPAPQSPGYAAALLDIVLAEGVDLYVPVCAARCRVTTTRSPHSAVRAVHRLDLTPLPRPTRRKTSAFARSKPITPDTPRILQQFLTGQEYCVHTTVRNGAVQVCACCASSAFQVNYEMVDNPAVEAWVRGFVEPLKLTGRSVSTSSRPATAGCSRSSATRARTRRSPCSTTTPTSRGPTSRTTSRSSHPPRRAARRTGLTTSCGG